MKSIVLKSIFILAVLSFGQNSYYSQYSDEVKLFGGTKLLTSEDGFKKWRFSVDLDSRNTVNSVVRAKLGGLRLGLEYRRVHRFGVALYAFDRGIEKKDFSEIDENLSNVQFDFSYLSLYYERVLFFNKKWEALSAFHFGSGTIETTYQIEGDDNVYTYDPIIVKPIEMTVSGYYHLTWWFSLGGGVGYRYMRKTPKELKTDFNGTIYIVKAKIRLGKLVKTIFDKEVKDEY